ncbi:DHHA1 domain-containing protein [Jhaorihella thermophila]
MGVQPGSGRGLDGNTYSVELCGGTHVRRTGDIGEFVLLSDSASSAGVRRVEALTGIAAQNYVAQMREVLGELQAELKVTPDKLLERIRADQAKLRELSNEVAQLRRELAMAGGASAPETREVGGVPFVAQVLTGVTGKDLPPLIDEHKARLGSGAILLIADTGGKVAVAAGVTPDLTDRVSAVDLVRAAVAELGGKGGGGRPDLAQGGARDAANAEAAIKAAEKVLEG